MVKVEKLGVFLSSINAFFAQIDDAQVAIDTPYLNNNKSAIGYDYSGVIKISGPLEGCVYVSAPSIMLREVIKVMGEPDSSITMMKDLLGEMKEYRLLSEQNKDQIEVFFVPWDMLGVQRYLNK